MKTLVVEDDEATRLVLADLASEYGACDEAADGAEALDAVESAIVQGEPYGLVLLDIRMPNMDGQTALQEIRSIEERAGLWPGRGASVVIMTTCISAPDTIMDTFREQCDAYLVKPVQSAALRRTLERLGLATSS